MKTLYPLATLALMGIGATASNAGEFAPALRGVWQTDGYGYVVDIRRDFALAYNFAQGVCTPVEEMELTPEMFAMFYKIVPGATADELHFLALDGSHAMWADRRAALPPECATLTPDTPIGNFEAFAAFFDAHHRFLPFYNIDWPARVAHARTKVTADMTDTALFALMAQMIGDISDPHTALFGIVNGEPHVVAPDQTATDAAIAAALASGQLPAELDLAAHFRSVLVAEGVLHGNGDITANDMISYGLTAPGVGYIAFHGIYGFGGTETGMEDADITALHTALDMILSQFATQGVESVILDISNNPGGDDGLSRAIAGHFTDDSHIAYSKRPLDGQRQAFTAYAVTPAAGVRFTGPVGLITSNLTYSAAEILTMSLRALPNVVHYGQPTGGGLSDILNKTLPNGWGLAISNELYLDHTGQSWEGIGIAPDIEIAVFPADNLLGGHALAVEAVVAHLQSH